MSQVLSDSVLTLSQRLYDIATANKATWGVQDVWYGDQVNLPRTPALCIEPGRKTRQFAGAPDMTDNNFDVFFLLYHGAVRETQTTRKEAITCAEAIEKYFQVNHFNLANASGDQIALFGYFREVDPGYVYKNGTLYSAVRMTWNGYTKTSLRNPPPA